MTQTAEDLNETQQVNSPATASFITKKFAFQTIIEKALVVLPTNDVVQVVKNFHIEASGDESKGVLSIAATDLDLWALASTNVVTVTQPGAIALPGAKLVEIAQNASDDDLTVVAENGVAKITVGRTTWELRMPDGSEYPPFPSLDDIDFYAIDRGPFAAALATVRHAASTESTRSNLMMVDINGGRMRAADGVRYQQVQLANWPDGLDTHIPTGAVDVLLKLLRTTEVEQIEIGDTEDQLVFKIVNDVFVASKLTMDFPDVDKMLLAPAMGNDQELSVGRADLDRAIKRVRITADPETSAVALVLTKDKVEVRSQDKYGNSTVEELDASWSSAERTAAFNHRHLSDMLASIDSPVAKFSLGKDTKTRRSPLLLRDDSSGTVGVLTQQRLDWVL